MTMPAVGDAELAAVARGLATASGVPGFVVGRSVCASTALAAVGYADLDALRPVAADSPFRLSSVTKVLTTIAVLRLVDDGLIALTDSVARFTALVLPGDVTVQHLLTHTSGLAFDGWVHVGEGEPLLKIEDCTITVAAPAGSTRAYSNQGFAVLGRVIEHCTTQSWRDHIGETVLRPLGMHATVLFDPPAFPDGYTEDADAIVREDRYTPGYEPAAAGWTTAADLLALGHAVIDPELGLVSDAAYSLMNRNYADVSGDLTQGLGLLRFSGARGDVLFHTGGWPGWSSSLAVRRADETCVAVGANRSVEARSDWARDLLGD